MYIIYLGSRYLYSDETDVTGETASALLKLGHYYQVPTLLTFCEEQMEPLYTVDNVCSFLEDALLFDLTKVKVDACNFIDEHVDEVLNSEGFMEISKQCLAYILKGDTLATDETLVLEKAMECSVKSSCRKSNRTPTGRQLRILLGDAFFYIRFPTMDIESFSTCTRRKDYFNMHEYEDIVASISGSVAESEITTNSCVKRIPLTEKIVFPQNLCQTEVKQGIVACALSLEPDMSFMLVGFKLLAPSFMLHSTGYSSCYTKSEGAMRSVICTVSIPELSFEDTFVGIADTIYFKTPVICLDETLTLSFKMDFSWIYKFVDCLNNSARDYRGNRAVCSGIKLQHIETSIDESGHFGFVKDSDGSCFVERLLVRHYSRRERHVPHY